MRHKHLPKLILKKKKTKQIQKESKHRKKLNIMANNKPKEDMFVPERK